MRELRLNFGVNMEYWEAGSTSLRWRSLYGVLLASLHFYEPWEVLMSDDYQACIWDLFEG